MSSRHARFWSTSTCSVASRRGYSLAVVLLIASFAAGCGGDSASGGPQESASGALSALAAGEGEEACSYLTPEAQQEIVTRAPALLAVPANTTCPDLVTAAATLVAPYKDRLEKPSFLSVSESGDTATLTFVGAGFPIQMEKRDGKWLISASTIQSAAARSAANQG